MIVQAVETLHAGETKIRAGELFEVDNFDLVMAPVVRGKARVVRGFNQDPAIQDFLNERTLHSHFCRVREDILYDAYRLYARQRGKATVSPFKFTAHVVAVPRFDYHRDPDDDIGYFLHIQLRGKNTIR